MRSLVSWRWIAMFCGLLDFMTVTGNIEAFGADLRGFLRHQVSQQATGTTGHGPTERAVASVQEQVAERCRANDRRAVRGGRTQTGPETRLGQIAALRIKVVDDHLQGFTPTRVQRQVKTGNLRHAADTDAVVETGDRDLVGLIQNSRCRGHRRVGDRHGQGVTLERIHRRLDAQRLEQLRRVAAECEDVAVSGFQLAVDPYTVDAVTGVIEALDVLAVAELHAQLHGHFSQAGGEYLAV